ncbi:MAG TPA: LytTR family DNA-binding domain-containing protein [Saprospiraceae bacterium]|nr:LytTR family DNA-binding domain-containing protein [Saprospiraceae bacterium]
MKTVFELSNNTNSLAVSTTGRIDIIDWNRLVRIEADSNYCRLFLENGRTLFVAKVLKKFEKELDRKLFIRPHNSHLVNRSFISSYMKGVHASLVLSTGEQIPVSRRKKSLFA